MSTETFSILLVDDDARHRDVYKQVIIDRLPVDVRFAGDGEEALATLASSDPPDLVVLDLDLPKLRGEEVLTRIKSDARLRFVPVIILTGEGGEGKQMELLDAGADDFIEKGSTPEVLVARLKAQMRHKLAVDRLESVALERDLFAAGVLADIGSIKWAILSACGHVKTAMRANATLAPTSVPPHLDKLTSVASKLGSYAAGVIQTVRDTSRKPTIAPLDVRALCEWVGEVLQSGPDGSGAKVGWRLPKDLAAVLADKNFLRLAWLNIVQYCLSRAGDGMVPVLTVTQEPAPKVTDHHGRAYLRTSIRDEGPPLLAKDIARLFHPSSIAEGSTGHLGLALAAKVMAKMGGRASADAPAGGAPGIVFRLDLPQG